MIQINKFFKGGTIMVRAGPIKKEALNKYNASKSIL